MSRGRKIAAWILASLVALVIVLEIAAIIVVRTPGFREFVREKIVAEVETSTGGRAEIGSFSFDWSQLHAHIAGFVLHGAEPAGAAPLFRARSIDVRLKLTSPFKHLVDIASLVVDTPQANVIVNPDGTTNVPSPRIQHTSNKSGLETVVDLAIGHFDLRNGSLAFANRKISLNAAGQNLRAQLFYNPVTPSYQGQVTLQPLLVRSGANQPVNIRITLPLVLEKDAIRLTNARIETPASQIVISGAMSHLVSPRVAAHLNARIALDEVRRAAGPALSLNTGGNLPRYLNADVNASMDDQRIQVSTARVDLGQTNLEASGTLKDTAAPAGLRFNASLALDEIGRLFRVAARPQGTVRVGGNARLVGTSDYLVTANVNGRGLAFGEGSTRLSGVGLDSAVTVKPELIQLAGFRLSALGGTITGKAALERMAQFNLDARLNQFEIRTITGALMAQRLNYDGAISGRVEAQGNVKQPAETVARARLAIAPGHRGVPVSGRVNADYNGRADTVVLDKSYVAMPNTRLEVSGSLGSRVDVRLVSRNLDDFKPLLSGPPPVRLSQGSITFTGAVTGQLSAPRISGHLAAANFVVEDRPFNSLGADLLLSPSGAALQNGMLARDPMQVRFAAAVGLAHWKAEPREPLNAGLAITNADVRDILALAGEKDVPVSGALTASARIAGTVGSPQGDASLNVARGVAYDEPFDQLTARVTLSEQSIDLPSMQLTAGASRLDLNASYQHPRGDLRSGQIRAHVASSQVALQQFKSLQKERPGLAGTVQFLADVLADVRPAAGTEQVQLTSVSGNLSARGLRMQGKNLGDLTASAQTAGTRVDFRLDSDFAGSNIRVTGQSQLTGDHPTTADAGIRGLPIEQVLAVAGRHDIPAAGTLSTTASFTGTLADPHLKANLTVARGTAYQEPFDRLEAAAEYSKQLVNLTMLRLVAGPNRVEASGSFSQPRPGEGRLQFHLASNRLQLARIHHVQLAQPGLGGSLEITADGAGTLRNSAPLLSALNAKIAAAGVTLNGKPVGGLTVTANTSGTELSCNLASDFAGANIRGDGRVALRGNYPLSARLTFAHVTYAGLQPLLGQGERPGFDALVEGEASVNGPAATLDELKGALQLSRLEVNSNPGAEVKPRKTVALRNAGPVVVALDRSTIRIQSARIEGPGANLNLAGTALLRDPKTVNLHAAGNVNLEILEAFDPNIFSAGTVTLNAAVQGTTAKPLVNGSLRLQNASFNMLDAPNGISNANGVIAFNGDRAVIQSLTGESGGGKIALSGFVGYGGPEMLLRLQATVDKVRVQYPEGVTTQASANVNLNGTTRRSLLSGAVTIEEVAMHSHSDIGSMLSQTATPPSPPQSGTGLMDGMRFDVRIQTAPAVRFRTTLAQNLQASASLRLRGSPSRPGMLGRVNATSGQIVFFGNQYTIQRGTVAFYNPQKIEPILNIDLQTVAQGVTVELAVSGPADRLKLSYHSDPPMQFSDIVALLATGKLNTTDPVLAARQPPPPQQTIGQKGASALLGQAVANPVAGRLQRLFGVTKLKIDPQLIGAQNTPQARLSLEQQINKRLSFTYIEDVASSNPQIVRVQWDVNPIWTAILERQENGEIGLDIFYKKNIR